MSCSAACHSLSQSTTYHGRRRGGQQVPLVEHDERAGVDERQKIGVQRRIRCPIKQAYLDVGTRKPSHVDVMMVVMVVMMMVSHYAYA